MMWALVMHRYAFWSVGLRSVLVGASLLVGTMSVSRADPLPFLPPGDARLRHIVEIEADDEDVPLATTWPLPTRDLVRDERPILYSSLQPGTGADAGWFVSVAKSPDSIRTFDDTPREQAQAGVAAGWTAGDYAGGVIKISYAAKPVDGMHFRFDDSYVAWRYGNWWVSLGQQQRWWGPGWDASLILSNNARPMPAIALDRASAEPFKTPWLSWLGPWRLTTFMGLENKEGPEWPHPLVWGARATARPLRDLEVGVSTTEQWCRVHVCGLHTFADVLLGKNNAGVNISTAKQPGNGELGWDFRWHLWSLPAAVYYQVNGETSDGKTPLLPRPRQTTNLLGVEFWSPDKGSGGWRGFVEFADTTCGALSTASSDQPNPGCAYTNNVVPWGYYYRGRVLGDSIQGDSRLLTVGALLLGEQDRVWDLRVRKGSLNRYGENPLNTLAQVPSKLWNFDAKLNGHWWGMNYAAGVGVDRQTPRGLPTVTTPRAFLSVSAPWH